MAVLFDLQANILPALLTTASIVLFLLWKRRKEAGGKNHRLPPGPAPAPLVGNLFQMCVKEPNKCYMKVCIPFS